MLPIERNVVMVLTIPEKNWLAKIISLIQPWKDSSIAPRPVWLNNGSSGTTISSVAPVHTHPHHRSVYTKVSIMTIPHKTSNATCVAWKMKSKLVRVPVQRARVPVPLVRQRALPSRRVHSNRNPMRPVISLMRPSLTSKSVRSNPNRRHREYHDWHRSSLRKSNPHPC